MSRLFIRFIRFRNRPVWRAAAATITIENRFRAFPVFVRRVWLTTIVASRVLAFGATQSAAAMVVTALSRGLICAAPYPPATFRASTVQPLRGESALGNRGIFSRFRAAESQGNVATKRAVRPFRHGSCYTN